METLMEPVDTGSLKQFVSRVNKTFPGYRNGEWSLQEQLVFKDLMFQLVQQHGYAAVTPEMLEGIRDDMEYIIEKERRTMQPLKSA
jgi:hypothetical protein